VGSLQNRTYEDKDGNKRTVTDIVANEVEFLSSKGAGEGQEEEPRPMSSGSKKPELEVMADDDQLPF
jgi:single-strand DNA-binding protein